MIIILLTQQWSGVHLSWQLRRWPSFFAVGGWTWCRRASLRVCNVSCLALTTTCWLCHTSHTYYLSRLVVDWFTCKCEAVWTERRFGSFHCIYTHNSDTSDMILRLMFIPPLTHWEEIIHYWHCTEPLYSLMPYCCKTNEDHAKSLSILMAIFQVDLG